ncbi:DNA-binding transcriptional regulator, LysR family [Collimonas sp. OK307]|uniref:LysR family transcriptional regulator n=1 Tax=Collimonas sp. OK307 TaxID=1801620 RepID=UPI0008F26FC3|nr:LysR family transcriptional regulator [Collimonas sp. OK307]SFH71794.1 DNA-binding transcriptional regulator, LysR family [Collimonas sp. OK307]
MNNLDANSLIIFYHVASSGSLTKAAEALGLSRSALSHRIKAIEARLGCQLLIRTTRSVGLTDAGYRLAAYASRIADTLSEANLLANGLNQDTAGLVRISAPSGLGSVWLRPLLMAYMQANPLVNIDVRLSEFGVDITKDPFDLAIRVTSQPPENVVAKKLFDVSWWLCASPALASRFADDLAALDLSTIPIAGFSRASQLHEITLTRGTEKLVATRPPVLVSNELEMVRDAVARSLGMAVLPDYYAKQEVQAGRLLRLLPDWQVNAGFGDQAYALHLPGRMLPLRVKRLIDFLSRRS